MTTLLHLSDLHLDAPLSPAQEIAIDLLFRAIARELSTSGERARAVVITGDLFDSSSVDRGLAADTLRDFCAGLRRATGPGVPALILPGNHDRRRLGILGPADPSLFRALARAVGPEVRLFGNSAPFLAELVPASLHGLPFHVVAYDSTMLTSGLLSAGGLVRQEDLLSVSAEIDAIEAGSGGERRPVLLLLHHHLVPTPLTDVGPIETHRLPALAHLALHRVLPVLVAHADREELTMTALGSGSALSMLHAMRRAVLVLHGHKHVATARKLERVREGDGDVLLASAGSAGVAQSWTATVKDAARLWPSFNVIELNRDALAIETVSFGYKGRSRGAVSYRPLVWAEKRGAEWRLAPVPEPGAGTVGPELMLDESIVSLLPSAEPGRWDARVERVLERAGTRSLRRYVESVEGAPGARWLEGGQERPLPARLELVPGQRVTLALRGAYLRTWAQARKVRGDGSAPFDSVALMNRYRSATARLVVRGLPPPVAASAFGSIVDLGTGEERPAAVTIEGDTVELRRRACPARMLLRIHFALAHR